MWTDVLFFLEVMRRRISRALARGGAYRFLSGLPMDPEAGPHNPGVLLLQIDGLSRRQFERAVETGKMPFLQRLMQREDYLLRTLYSGIPSTTPAVQGELYYGVACAVPAFGYLDVEERDFVLMKEMNAARRVEETLREQGDEPLLKGGSSWMNVYSGGASIEETHFSSVTFRAREMLRPRSLWRALLISMLHLPFALRTVLVTVIELILGVWDMARAVLAGENFAKEVEFIISRVVIGAAIREVLVLGGTVDVNRGLPIIHVNFLGYDERSHRRGPATKFAHAELRRIDRALERLYEAAVRSDSRDYQVWVFSDHGHENARSYEEQHPEGIGQVISEALQSVGIRTGAHAEVSCRSEYDRSWLRSKKVRKHLEEQEKPESEEATKEPPDFAVLARGPVAHIYLARKLGFEEKERLAQALVQEKNLPAVGFMRTDGKSAAWVHEGGVAHLPEDGARLFAHPPGIREEVGRDLVRLCAHPNSGDLVLFGWHSEKQPWTFPFERGAHAGPGLDETQAFCLLPAGTRLPAAAAKAGFLRARHLREAILDALGRQRLEPGARRLEETPSGRLRVMTYNVHSCIGLDGRLSCSRIIRIIRGFDPDIVALQEVDIERKRSRGENQVERIARELQMHHAFCSTVERGRERYGHALLSRFPMELAACGKLLAPRRAGTEPRGALIARIHLPSGGVWVLNTHLGLRRLEREQQVAELLGPHWLGKVPQDEALVVCGDFNMLPGSRAYLLMTSRLRDAQSLTGQKALPTFVSTYPITRVDYVFVNNLATVEALRAPRNSLTTVASDHLPLIAEIVVSAVTQTGSPPGLDLSARRM